MEELAPATQTTHDRVGRPDLGQGSDKTWLEEAAAERKRLEEGAAEQKRLEEAAALKKQQSSASHMELGQGAANEMQDPKSESTMTSRSTMNMPVIELGKDLVAGSMGSMTFSTAETPALSSGPGTLASALKPVVPQTVLNTLLSTQAQTRANTAALKDYAKRVWKISNWWRSPPQCNRPTTAEGKYIKPKVLIVYSDTGGGHKASANAIIAAFEHICPGELDVKPVDVIEEYSLWASNRTYNFFVSVYIYI